MQLIKSRPNVLGRVFRSLVCVCVLCRHHIILGAGTCPISGSHLHFTAAPSWQAMFLQQLCAEKRRVWLYMTLYQLAQRLPGVPLCSGDTEFVFYVSLPVQYFYEDQFREHMMHTDSSSSNSRILFRAHFCIKKCIVYSIPYLGHLLKGPALHLQLSTVGSACTCHLVKKNIWLLQRN